MSFEKSLSEALTTHEYNDVTGAITVNVADGLFAIATAINRLAAVHEQAQRRADDRVEEFTAMIMRDGAARQ